MVLQFEALPDAQAFREHAKADGMEVLGCVSISPLSGKSSLTVERTADAVNLAALFGGRVLRRVDVFGR